MRKPGQEPDVLTASSAMKAASDLMKEKLPAGRLLAFTLRVDDTVTLPFAVHVRELAEGFGFGVTLDSHIGEYVVIRFYRLGD